MKRILSVFALILLGVLVGRATGHLRYEQIDNQKMSWDAPTAVSFIETWHDQESGVEFTCVFTRGDYGHKVSCFPTGRNWK